MKQHLKRTLTIMGKGKNVLLVLFTLALFVVAWMGTSRVIHAAGIPLSIQSHTCADTQNTAQCNGEDPIMSHCVLDARTLNEQVARQGNNVVGFVDLRTSPTCHTYWVRAVAYANSGVVTLEATVQLAADPRSAPGATATIPTSLKGADGSIQVYTDMSYQQRPPTEQAFCTFFFARGPSVTVHV